MSKPDSITQGSSALTDSTGGTGAATLVAVTSTYDEAVVSNNFSSLVDIVNALTIDVAAILSALDTSHSRIKE